MNDINHTFFNETIITYVEKYCIPIRSVSEDIAIYQTDEYVKITEQISLFFEKYNKKINKKIVTMICFYNNHPELIDDKELILLVSSISNIFYMMYIDKTVRFMTLNELFMLYNKLYERISKHELSHIKYSPICKYEAENLVQEFYFSPQYKTEKLVIGKNINTYHKLK